ncbi:MAG: DUF2147 domain-containing protein [Thermodesulfobacteriota bacterium]|nr:DUF2147 domain-containing protein [Thermodesulfobacteriota bacterium]
MVKRIFRAMIALAAFSLFFPFYLSASQNMDADAILGQWTTKNTKSVVTIFRNNDSYSMKIVWLKEPLQDNGAKKVDENNPDIEKQKTEIIGLVIGSGFKFKEDNLWEDGQIYDPDNGKTYSCKLTLDKEKLKVRGFIGFSLFGRTEIWQKKSEN